MDVVVLDLRGSSKILIIEHFCEHLSIDKLIVHKKVCELGVFKAENAEEGEEVPKLVIHEEVLAADIEELLDRQ